LDTRTSHEIMGIIQRLNREQGVTVILVTHETDIAAYADRLITMRDGQIVSDERQAARTATPAVGGARPPATPGETPPPDGGFGLAFLGTNMIVVQPGATSAGGVRAGAGSASTLTVVDAAAIQRDDPAVAQVSYLTRQMAQAQHGDLNWNTVVQGVTPSYLDIVSWRIAEGEAMTEQENDTADTVCLIGRTVYQNLFGPGEDPIGATVLIKGVPMRV